MKGLLPSLGLVFVCASALASDFGVSVKSGGGNFIKVTPGSTVSYAVEGGLSDAQNEGLALFCFDLQFSGGPLAQANAPSANPMLNFASPLGINNPAGFGGTPIGGKLIQVGGGQNTILNLPNWGPGLVIPPAGQTVLLGVGKFPATATLVTGSLAAPYKVGSYTLAASNVAANAIKQGETGFPFWRVEAANPGGSDDLVIEVEALSADKLTISGGIGEKQTLTLNAGPANAGRPYLLLGSASGTSPGVTLNTSVLIPLNRDGYFMFTWSSPNSGPLSNSAGLLNAQGKASAAFQARPRLIGMQFHHAFILTGPIDFVSNPVSVTVTP